MGTSGAHNSIENHGTAIDKEKNRVRCKYCGKEVRGFNRLKHHLGGVGNDVVACIHVPADVKTCMRDDLLEKKKERLAKEVGDLHHPDLPLKRNVSSPSNEPRRCQPKLIHPESSINGCLTSGTPILDNSNGNGSVSHVALNHPSPAEKGKNVMDPTPGGSNGNVSVPIMKEEDAYVIKKEEVKDDSSSVAAKGVGRFFFEAGIDLNAIKLPSFQKMMDAAIKCGSGFKVPKYNELRGWILQEDLEEVQERVQDVKLSWGRTGCSILLDIWTDQRGRRLIGILVDCPRGTIFLRSVDASNVIEDTDALVSLFSRVIEEVGVHNVVQVITHDASCYMGAAGKKLEEKYKTLFWSVCADHCINLILERIEAMDHVKKVLAKAKNITRFIYSHALPLELMSKHILGGDLIRTSMLKSVSPFMTLENMVSEKESLMSMFTSQTWINSTWSSKTKGKMASELVEDSSFWTAAVDILKITNPLIGVLRQINGSDAAPMGFLYDTMDRAKEEIKKNVGGEEATYLPYWKIIDGIWDNYLHSPLHSAAYYLNPSFFYSNDFFVDAEVTNGLLRCIVRMAEDQQQQEMISLQLDAYRAAIGGFAEEMAIDQRSKVQPAIWWSLHGGQSPELQKLAIKILSQTCSTALRYKLRKDVSEQLHTHARNSIERQRFFNMELVHNNLRLWQSPSIRDPRDSITLEALTPLDDWVVEDV